MTEISNLSMIKPLSNSSLSLSRKEAASVSFGGNVSSSGGQHKPSNRAVSTKAAHAEKHKQTADSIKLSQTPPQPPFSPAGIHMLDKHLRKSMTTSYTENSLKQSLYSTWTPLNDERSNQRLYEERKQLGLKWFDTWSESQRRQFIDELFRQCKPKQLLAARDSLDKIAPVYHVDFTRILPRVICMYIMSYLDPRSLSRCSQVCWYWKMIAESDQLWMPKCIRFGWKLNYMPSSFESGIWKQFYIENIRALRYVPVQRQFQSSLDALLSAEEKNAMEASAEQRLRQLSYGKFSFSNSAGKSKTRWSAGAKSTLKQPPWRANNSNPNHFYRFNYLEEQEAIAAAAADKSRGTVDHQFQQSNAVTKSMAGVDSSSAKPPLNTNKITSSHLQASIAANTEVGKQHIHLNSSNIANVNDANATNISIISSNKNKIDELIEKGQIIMNQLNSNKSLFTDPQSGDASSQQQQQQTTMLISFSLCIKQKHEKKTAEDFFKRMEIQSRKPTPTTATTTTTTATAWNIVDNIEQNA